MLAELLAPFTRKNCRGHPATEQPPAPAAGSPACLTHAAGWPLRPAAFPRSAVPSASPLTNPGARRGRGRPPQAGPAAGAAVTAPGGWGTRRAARPEEGTVEPTPAPPSLRARGPTSPCLRALAPTAREPSGTEPPAGPSLAAGPIPRGAGSLRA